MRMRLAILWLLLVIPASAEWRRHVLTAKDGWFDAPQSHPLAYFVRDPFLRDDGNDFCISCTPAEKATLHLKIKAKTDVKQIGVLNGFAVYDVLYYFGEDESPAWKAVLVKVSPDQYREIFHVQRTQVDQYVGPSRLVNVGREQLLSTVAFAGGNKGMEYGDYFWLSKDGPVIVDTSTLVKAANAALPSGKRAYGQPHIDFPTLTARIWAISEDEYSCCSGGVVVVNFQLQQGRMVISESRYDSSARPWDSGRGEMRKEGWKK
jgi:hypothetical protein